MDILQEIEDIKGMFERGELTVKDLTDVIYDPQDPIDTGLLISSMFGVGAPAKLLKTVKKGEDLAQKFSDVRRKARAKEQMIKNLPPDVKKQMADLENIINELGKERIKIKNIAARNQDAVGAGRKSYLKAKKRESVLDDQILDIEKQVEALIKGQMEMGFKSGGIVDKPLYD